MQGSAVWCAHVGRRAGTEGGGAGRVGSVGRHRGWRWEVGRVTKEGRAERRTDAWHALSGQTAKRQDGTEGWQGRSFFRMAWMLC